VETPAPFLFSLNIAGLPYPAYRAFVALTSILCVIGLWLFLFRLKFGRWIRATQQNRELALSLGIPLPFVYGLTFGMGAWLAALAGVLTSPIVAVDYRMGLEMLIVSFVVVIVGGLGSLKGAVLVAIIFSTLEGILAIKTEPTAARIIVLLVMGAVLLIRPQGLFGRER
jgi:branched-chain amino acid transport system permease protein